MVAQLNRIEDMLQGVVDLLDVLVTCKKKEGALRIAYFPLPVGGSVVVDGLQRCLG